jgi:hypothetical protein
MIALRQYARLPAIQNGYELDDQFSVVVPVARTNLVTNPSFEVATTSWAAIGGSIARSTLFQYHGAYSLAITPTAATTDGARFDTVSLIGGTTYAYSCKVLGAAGRSYKLSIETTAGVELVSVTFTATGRWQWIYGYYAENATTTRRVALRKAGGTETSIFYIDGVQVEAVASGELVSTYIDGDQLGFVPNQAPPAYVWNGTPHASTSTRSGLTRAGGMVINFRTFGFFLTAIIGLGLANPFNAATEYARIDGGYDDYTRKPSRQFTLSGQFQGLDYPQLRQNRGGLARLLDRDLIGQDQRLLLLRQVIDPCGVVQTSTCRIVGKYQGGLSGNTDNQSAEQAALTFTQYLSTVLADGESGSALNVQTSVANANYFITRTPAGAWQILGASGANAVVRAIAVASNGDVFVGGDFTDFGGSGADYIARWNGSSWNTVGGATALNNTVYALAFGPTGLLYVGGAFTNAGGNASADGIATWDGASWGNLSTGTLLPVICLAVTPTGTLYAGGQFTSIGGSTADNIAYWNGSAWSNLASDTAINNNVYALAIGLDGKLYVGGAFTNANGIADADHIASWDGSSWAALSTGTVNDVLALAIGPNGWLYAGGGFTTIGGVSASHIAQWNGVAWQPLGSGVTTGVNALAFIGNQLYVGGVIATAGGIVVPDGFAIWSGGVWTYTNVDLPGSATVYTLAAGPDGTLYVGFDTTGTATAASTTTITNPGTARSYPTIVIKGPSSGTARIFSILNVTTNRAIYLNYTINAGETATFVFTPDNLSFTSDFLGSIASVILPGSNAADFFLQPGANTITFLSASDTVTATLYFRPAYLSLDDVN